MRDHTGDYRGFTHTGGSWYAFSLPQFRDSVKDSISIGMYSPDGGTSGEFQIEWVDLDGKLTPRLAAFDDSWSALQNFGDLLARMALLDDKNIIPKQFCEMLISIGIQDRTERERLSDRPKATA